MIYSLLFLYVRCFQTLESVAEEHGGRVELAKTYYDGLTKSMVKNFNGTEIIASMQQCNEFFFLATKQISIGRVGNNIFIIFLFYFYCFYLFIL